MVANPTRGQLIMKHKFVHAWEFGLASRVRPSSPASARSFCTPRLNQNLVSQDGFGRPVPRQPACLFSTPRLNLVISYPYSRAPLSATVFIYTVNLHGVSPEFIGSRSCVPVAFTAESQSFPVLSTCPLHTNNSIVGVGKRGAYLLVHGDLPRQHSFGTTLGFTGPVPADSRQWTPSARNCVSR